MIRNPPQPGPPAAIPNAAIQTFLSKTAPEQKQAAAEGLLFFYRNAVRSEKYAGIIAFLQEPLEKPVLAENPFLDQLSKELLLRNYSRRTVKNYSAIVKKYLAWLQRGTDRERQ